MDFLRLLRSFEELIFEVTSWLVFVPRTLWLILRHPVRMVAYARHEQDDEGIDRYADALSPPLLLILMIAFAHGLELAAGTTPQATSSVAEVLLSSDQNLIIFRSLLFALLPLLAAIRYVTAKGLPFDRPNLRAPFMGQCYLAAVFALAISLETVFQRGEAPWGPLCASGVMLAAVLWYLWAQTLLYREGLGVGRVRGLVLSLQAFAGAWILVFMIALIIALAP